jgi:hypothetical protein
MRRMVSGSASRSRSIARMRSFRSGKMKKWHTRNPACVSHRVNEGRFDQNAVICGEGDRPSLSIAGIMSSPMAFAASLLSQRAMPGSNLSREWLYAPKGAMCPDREGGPDTSMGPKGKAKLARATKIREVVLRFMRKHARWDRLANGPEVLKYQDPAFFIIVSIQEEVTATLFLYMPMSSKINVFW